MSANSDLRLKKYSVKKLYFEMNEGFDFQKKSKIRIEPEFHRKIDFIDEDNYKVELVVRICEKAQKETIPFFAEVKVEGVFYFQEWHSEEKKYTSINNSTAILFPYLRSLLSSITTTGNLPPYFLPVMNVTKLFDDQEI